jgi:hypothetical protein
MPIDVFTSGFIGGMSASSDVTRPSRSRGARLVADFRLPRTDRQVGSGNGDHQSG